MNLKAILEIKLTGPGGGLDAETEREEGIKIAAVKFLVNTSFLSILSFRFEIISYIFFRIFWLLSKDWRRKF